MSAWMILLLGLVAMLPMAWVGREAARSASSNAPKFRDMPLSVSYGYVFAAAVIIFGFWYYFQPPVRDNGVPRAGVMFFRWAVQGILVAAIAGFIFKKLGEYIGTHNSRKFFRGMPISASFGILVILIYTFVAIFAGQITLVTIAILAGVLAVIWGMLQKYATPRTALFFAIFSIITISVFLLMYYLGPLAPFEQNDSSPPARITPGGDPAMGGDPRFPLGTDQNGRDLLSRIIFGAQNTVGIAFITTVLAFVIGVTLGFLAATLGGWLDQLLSRAVDVLMAIPSLIFSLLLMTMALVWAPRLGVPLTVFMVIIIAVIDSTRVFRLARAIGQNIVVMDYFEAAKLRGEGLRYLIFRELLPNATAPLLAEFGLRFCFVFLTIAALSFLGVGIQPPLADWGTMVRDLSSQIQNLGIISEEWASNLPTEELNKLILQATMPLIPAGAIALLTVAVNFVVDWQLNKSSGLKE